MHRVVLLISLLVTGSAAAQAVTPDTIYRPTGAESSLLDGLVEWWSMDETSGNRVGRHAGKVLEPLNAPRAAEGIHGKALALTQANLQGVYDNAGPPDTAFEATGSFTIALRYKHDDSGSLIGHFHLAGKQSGVESPTALEWVLMNDTKPWGGRVRLRVSIDDNWGFSEVSADEGALNAGQWNTIIASFDADDMLLRLYIFHAKGSATWSNNTSTPIVRPSMPFSIGTATHPSTSTSTQGLIDEVGFWNRVLSDAEVAEVAGALSYDDL